ALALGLDPIELRLRNALRSGDQNITGQVVSGVAPVGELLGRLAAAPMPVPQDAPPDGDMMGRPGGAGRTADARHVRRGIGYAVGGENLLFSEGLDASSTTRGRL